MKDSKIGWTDNTLNFWWGCCKVSEGCANCYAEVFSKRVGREIWGPAATTDRWRTKSPWVECLKWDKQAKIDQTRVLVFCQSMSDFFEEHDLLVLWRQEACQILERFEWIDVQLLTKRPENIRRMVPTHWLKEWPRHIWIGTSVESQDWTERVDELRKIPAEVRFLSCEPLLGEVTLDLTGIQWVISGGESGPKARPCHPDWVRSLRDQSKAANIPFFHKQWGEWQPVDDGPVMMDRAGHMVASSEIVPADWQAFKKTGKELAGSMLDGRYWEELPYGRTR